MRKMERTVDYLRYLNKTDIYNVNEFYRDVTLGFNTERNTRALYTGS